jgi:hypothetical protein
MLKEKLPNPFAVDYQYKDGPLDLYTEKEMIKYAEWLIEECCKVILENGWQNPIHKIRPEEPTEIVRYVKEHFGVNQ